MLRSVHATLIAVVMVVFSVLGAIEAAADQCSQSFSWIPNTETDLGGYKIYYGTTDGGPYPDMADVGKPAMVDGRIYGEVSGLTCGLTYYFVSVAYNTADEESAYSTQVSVTLDGGGNVVTAVVGYSSDANITGGITDTYININTENYVSGVTLNTYTWPENMVSNAIIMKLDTSVLPPDAQVQSAKLQLFAVSGGGNTLYTVSAHKIINHDPDLSAVTGYTYDGSQSWTPNTSAYNNIPMAQADIEIAESSVNLDLMTGYKSWDVTEMTKSWLANPSTNFGLLLNSNSGSPADSHRYFASSEAGEASQRPKWIVTYTKGEAVPKIISIEVVK